MQIIIMLICLINQNNVCVCNWTKSIISYQKGKFRLDKTSWNLSQWGSYTRYLFVSIPNYKCIQFFNFKYSNQIYKYKILSLNF